MPQKTNQQPLERTRPAPKVQPAASALEKQGFETKITLSQPLFVRFTFNQSFGFTIEPIRL